MKYARIVRKSINTKTSDMNLEKFRFPEVAPEDIAFSALETDPKLLDEAKNRGFYGGDGPYNKLFSQLFYEGGRVSFKEKIDPDFQGRVWKYFQLFMRSNKPSPNEKEAICAMLLSEVVNSGAL